MASPLKFLSCLYGSELIRLCFAVDILFLSYLYGSERRNRPQTHYQRFLSCLYGSEQIDPLLTLELSFLSCLYGSELRSFHQAPVLAFLSCLYGSELRYYTLSPLLIKRNYQYSPAQTLFYPYIPAHSFINKLRHPRKKGSHLLRRSAKKVRNPIQDYGLRLLTTCDLFMSNAAHSPYPIYKIMQIQ